MQTIDSAALSSKSLYSRASLLEVWRRALIGDRQADPTDVVIEELSAYFHLAPDEVVRRCRDWEQNSLKEWKEKDRTTAEGLVDFYKTQTSWIFDTMWYHAEQCTEIKAPESVDIAEGFYERYPGVKPGNQLDFGSGPGSCSLFFHQLGWKISLADISTTFLDFAKWRLKRHNVEASFYDMNVDQLPPEEFDLITAIDVIVHIPDVNQALAALNRALRPGGFLIFNIDNRPWTELNQWHLYTEQFPILREVRKHGFERLPKIQYFHIYQKTERSTASNMLIGLKDSLRYNWMVTLAGKVVRAFKRGS